MGRSKQKKKIWSLERCRQYYIENQHATVADIAELSGFSYSYLQKVCTEDSWKKQRDIVASEKRAVLVETIAQTRITGGVNPADIVRRHLEQAERVREAAYLAVVNRLAPMAETIDLDTTAGKTNEFLKQLNDAWKIIDSVSRFERETLGLDNLKIATAIKTLTEAGCVVTNPTTQAAAQLLAESGEYRVEKVATVLEAE